MTSEEAEKIAQAKKLFSLYPLLATRVTNLRTILQNVESAPISLADANAWVDDVKSVMEDYMQLNDRAAALVKHFIRETLP